MPSAPQRPILLVREFKESQERLLQLEPVPELDILGLDQLPPGDALVHPLVTDVRALAYQRVASRQRRRVLQPAGANAGRQICEQALRSGVLIHGLELDETAHHPPALGEDPPSLLGSLEPLGVVRLTQRPHGRVVVELPEGAFSL